MAGARDPAVEAILAAEAAYEQLARLVPKLKSPLPADVDGAIGEAQELYAEMWAHLDVARGILRDRGVAAPGFDALRARQPAERTRETLLALVTPTEASGAGHRDGRVAAAELRDALPGFDWAGLRRSGVEAASAPGRASATQRGIRLTLAVGGLCVLLVGAFLAMRGMRTDDKVESKVERRKAAAVHANQIALLRERLATKPCEAPSAELLTKLLLDVGQRDEAVRFGTEFIQRCGDNPIIAARIK